jgi:tetraacyldisaccharide 4'-kinase
MNAPSVYHRVIAANARPWSLPFRAVLRAASALYRVGVSARNRRYDHDPAASVRLPVPVISVGNITTGGTGKTPLVIEIARRLSEQHRTPAVLSRGYKATGDQEADELRLVRRRLPDIVCVADPDRFRGARAAIDRHGADVIVLDDGFQHRALARDVDIVLIDATCPFGYGHLLPRGLLREPIEELRRASLLVISRADQVDDASLELIEASLERYAPVVPRVRSRHRPAGLVALDGSNLTGSPDRVGPVFCFAAIANPAAFRRTVESTGIRVAGVQWWPDHHPYRERDVVRVHQLARRAGASALVTTEKDAVKLSDLAVSWTTPVYAQRIEIDFLDDGDTILTSFINQALGFRHGTDVTQSVSTH